MPERVTDAKITAKVNQMVKGGMDLGLDGQYGKFRVTNMKGSISLSPRASNREILDWLKAYEMGWGACDRRWKAMYSAGME